MCSFSWILFLTARLGGSFKSYAHFKVSISTRKGLLSKRLRSLQGIRSLCSMKKRCVKFTHRFASRVAKMEIRNVLRLSLRYLSSETDVGADNAVHPAFSSRRKAVVSHLQSRSHFGAMSEYSSCCSSAIFAEILRIFAEILLDFAKMLGQILPNFPQNWSCHVHSFFNDDRGCIDRVHHSQSL